MKTTDSFESITEMKESILWGGELEFRISLDEEYGIFKLQKDDIVLCVADSCKDNIKLEGGIEELHFSNVDKLLEYKLHDIPLKQILLDAEMTWRSL